MSMHFAPQWAKPIKPSGTSLTPTSETPNSGPRKTTLANSPFPALSHAQARASSPTTSTHPPLSYSRVTHTPLSPGIPGDGSYFPNQDANGGEPNAHPFRYSREQILALFDEAKFKERPIELVDVADGPAVLVSKSLNRPVGFRELTDVEKKLLATSVHPSAPARRTAGHTAGAPSADHNIASGLPTRRAAGFGRGEGGAFGGGGGLGGGKIGTIGGGMLSPGGLDHKAPGALGGGFGGVSKRMARPRGEGGETNGESTRPAVPNWRPNSRTTSGNFEGVLGFGSGPAVAAALPLSPTTDTHDDGFKTAKLGGEPKAVDGEEKKEEGGRFGKGGGPGWGTGQKKWRIAAGLSAPGENDKTIEMPISNNEHASASVIATPSATPIPERDASVLEPTPTPSRPQEEIQQPQEKEDLGALEWFYRDPNGQEQGPFTGTQMHDWYSHSYFTDDLPLRLSNETTFRPLAELKAATGNAVQPFLTPIRPRQLPPNLPIPMAALQPQGLNGLPDAFRGLAVQSPMGAVSPQSIQSSAPQAYTPGFDAFSPGYTQLPQSLDQAVSPGGFGPSPGQGWAQHPQALGRINMNGINTAYGSIGIPSPIGAAPLQYMQQQQPQQQQYFSPQQQMGMGGRSAPGDMYSPSVNAGIPVSPWGVPQQVQVPQQQQQPQQQACQQQMQMSPVYQQPQPQPMQMQMPAWTEQPQQQVQQQQQPQQVEVTPTQAPVEQLPEERQEVAQEQVQAPEPEVHDGGDAEEDDMDAVEADITPPAESPVATSAKPSPAAAAPASVWGKTATSTKPPSRKPSLASPPASAQLPAMPSTASKLPPPPSSLPAKPVGGRNAAAATSPKAETTTPQLPKVVAVATPGPTASPAEKTPGPKPAPWAIAKEDKPRAGVASPSLRDIQEAEARRAEARKQALAEARAASASPAPTTAASAAGDDLPTSMSWGLASQTKSASARSQSPAAASPVAPAWGGGGEAPKKTLKQIQEEEEKRKVRAAQAARVAQGLPAGVGAGAAAAAAAQGGAGKRGYADLAATQAPLQAGWTTVGSGGRTASGTPAAVPARVATPVKPAAVPAKSVAAVAVPAAVKKANGSALVDDGAPSVEFVRWTKQALTGFKGDVDDFIQVLLSFPVDPPASARADQLEIISDSVYANSSTLDGRRFAQEFYTRRKADAARPASGAAGKQKIQSLADVVKTQPKQDTGFKVVKKGKKKA